MRVPLMDCVKGTAAQRAGGGAPPHAPSGSYGCHRHRHLQMPPKPCLESRPLSWSIALKSNPF
eukprot:1156402-Pelagomonas_calceolata.AAC.7